MQHPTTKSVVLSMLNLPDGPPRSSFIHDVFNVMDNDGSNFFELVICQNAKRLPVCHNDIAEDVQNKLQDCLKNWNIGAKRKEFQTTMEERVPVRLE